jgi:hypothetical protein
VDDELGLALFRDRLRDLLGGFSGGVVAEFHERQFRRH